MNCKEDIRVELILIAAMSRNRVIGRDNAIPWNLPEELREFKEMTMGHSLVMGRKTFESIGRPLPGRRIVVVSRDPVLYIPGCEVVTSLQAAVDLLKDEQKIFIAGGAEIYHQALAMVDRVRLTVIDMETEGDVLFPELPEERFVLVEERKKEGLPGFTVKIYRRRHKEGPDTSFEVQVSCYSGYRSEETPQRFVLGSSTVEIKEILDRWLAPDHRYFKVQGDDGAVYILRHDVREDRWEVTLYRKNKLLSKSL